MRIKRLIIVLLSVLAVFILLFILYIGHYRSYIDHDEREICFIKKFPDFRSEFINPFANESDPKSVRELSADARRELADYCKFAYGITLNDSKSLEDCREKILREIL
ncbi:conserved hypothetical protein [Paraburkholderia sacchari]